MDEPVARHAAIKLQCLYRRKMARREVQKLFRRVVERVYDEESGDFFFYNVNTGESSWTAPSLLDEGTRLLSPEARIDMEDKIARGVWKSRETMTKVDAATTVQTLFRAVAARSRCRLLISNVFEKAIDPESGEAFYFNTRTGCTYLIRRTAEHFSSRQSDNRAFFSFHFVFLPTQPKSSSVASERVGKACLVRE